jgi:hypothetical protein
VQVPVAAEEWQLSWTAEALRAGELLPHLRVNRTAALEQHGLAPLAVPFTLAIEARALDAALLRSSEAGQADCLEQLGSLQCVGLKVLFLRYFWLAELVHCPRAHNILLCMQATAS